jgi:hypothetical protein
MRNICHSLKIKSILQIIVMSIRAKHFSKLVYFLVYDVLSQQ